MTLTLFYKVNPPYVCASDSTKSPLQNLETLVNMEIDLGTWLLHGPNMALTWSKKLDTLWTILLDHVDSVLTILIKL